MRPKLSSKSSQGMTTSQERSTGRHLVSHLLRGQNGESTPIPTNPIVKIIQARPLLSIALEWKYEELVLKIQKMELQNAYHNHREYYIE